MNLKKFAVRGMIVLAVFVALCMFFSGTIKTITTAKIKITQGRSGKLEEKIELSGKLYFSQVDSVGFDLDEGQTLTIVKVNTRPGYTVKEGDVLIEARVANYEQTMMQYQTTYDEALDQLLQLESKNSNIRLRKTDKQYAEAYFALRSARKESVSARIAMESLLMQEQLTLPEEGVPEGASENLIAAIEAYRAAAQTESEAQQAMDAVERYLPDDTTWAYISDKHVQEEKIAECEAKMQALSELNGAVRSICAPHDGYTAEVFVKAGDVYDGSTDLFSMTKADTMPVLRADVSEIERAVTEGTTVTMSSDRYGDVESKVVAVGIDDEGKKYVDIEVNDDVINARGSVYSMTLEDTPMKVVYRSRTATTLISSSAIHGSGDNRYVYTVDRSYSSFGNSKMTVHKMTVTVLAEVDGVASIEEEIAYYDIAYMEDRPINDGDTVMLYVD